MIYEIRTCQLKEIGETLLTQANETLPPAPFSPVR